MGHQRARLGSARTVPPLGRAAVQGWSGEVPTLRGGGTYRSDTTSPVAR